MAMDATGRVIFVLFGVGLGLTASRYAVARYRQLYHLVAVDRSAVVDLRSRSGPVEVAGTVEAAVETIDAPFSGSESVYCRFSARDRHEAGRSDLADVEGERRVPFFLNDGFARVLVDPAGATVEGSTELLEVERGERPPDSIARFYEEHPDVDPPADATFEAGGVAVGGSGTRQFWETRIDVGDEATVVGTARPDPDVATVSGQVDTVVDGGGAPLFSISTGSGSDAKRTALTWGAVATAFVLVGAAFVYVGAAG